jgi:hypothetical protein
MIRFLKRRHRDLAALAFLLVVYPQLTNEAHLSNDSPTLRWVLVFWFVMAVVGIAATVIKLRALEPTIGERKAEQAVKAPANRFLAAMMALPLVVEMPLFMLLGEDSMESWIGPVHMVLGVALWITLTQLGRKGGRAPLPRWLARSATVALILFELHLYTIFLESLWITDQSFHVTLRTLFVLLIPMVGLFYLLFLPATIGFYIEECTRRGSAALAGGVLLLRFVFYRYLPTYLVLYLEGRGLRLPWIF